MPAQRPSLFSFSEASPPPNGVLTACLKPGSKMRPSVYPLDIADKDMCREIRVAWGLITLPRVLSWFAKAGEPSASHQAKLLPHSWGPPQSSANRVYSKHVMKQAVREKVALPHGHPVCNMKAVTDGAGWSGNATLVRTTTPTAARPVAPPQPPPQSRPGSQGVGSTHLPGF